MKPLIEIMLEVVVRDKNGRIIARRRKRAGYLNNFVRAIRCNDFYLAETLRDLGGTNRSLSAGSSFQTPTIRVGSGSTAQTPGDYKLETELGTTGASVGAVVVVGQNSQFTISGSVTLSAGGTVREVGVSCVCTYVFLFFRDVVPEVPVPTGGTCTVVYTLIFTA